MNFDSQSYSVLLTGFGPFGSVKSNPSSELITLIQNELLQKSILSKILFLPVSYCEAPNILDNVLNQETFDLVLGFGLHRGNDFRLEIRARPVPSSQKPDIDGHTGDFYRPRFLDELKTNIISEHLIFKIEKMSQLIRISDDASGYVCEAIYHHLLCLCLPNAIPCAFIHIPSFNKIDSSQQCLLMTQFIYSLLDNCSTSLNF